jgi:hypothetical protein
MMHSLKTASDPVAQGFLNFLKETGPFEGIHQELLKGLIAFRSAPPGGRAWPAMPRALTSSIRRAAPNLRKVGVVITFSKRSGGNRDRIIRAEIVTSAVPESTAATSSLASPKRPKRRAIVPQSSLFPENEIEVPLAKNNLGGTVGTIGTVVSL